MAGSEPVRSDLRHDPFMGDFWDDWHCDPLPEGTPYRAVRYEWAGRRDGRPVRRIFEAREMPVT